MNPREWALIIFTTLAQLSVGTLIVLLIVRTYVTNKSGAEQAGRMTDLPFYAVVGAMILALIASLFHLGKVVHVIGAVPNLSTSWMSREVVTSVTFMILTAVLAFLIWRKLGTEALRMVIGWVSAVVGLLLLFFMSMTYMLPSQPAWNTWATPVMFYTTSLLLGVLGAAAALVFTHVDANAMEGQTMKGLAIASIVLMGLELLVTPFYLAFLSTQGTAALHTLNLMVGTYGWALVIRLVLVFVGGGLLATYLFENASATGKEKVLATLAYSAFVLVLVSEFLGRFIFYATHYRIGI